MQTLCASSRQTDVAAAVADIRTQLGGNDAALILYFSAPRFPSEALAAAMKAAFPKCLTLGCTTSGEIVTGQMLKDSLVAMAMGKDLVRSVRTAFIDDVSSDASIRAGLERVAGGASLRTMDPSKYVGLVLIDGLSGCEERVNSCIGDVTEVPFVGGSAGDNLAFKRTFVMLDGQAKSNAAVLALLEPACPFQILKTQSFEVMKKELVPTKLKPGTREVLEFNGRPAAQAYAEALGTTVKDLPSHFERHPVGLLTDTGIFVRSPQQVRGDDVVFYCQVHQGTPLALLKGTDIVADTRAALEGKQAEMEGLRAIINFNCILRTLDLEKQKKADAYGALFKDAPTVGLSTYGESYIGHINQTATMLLFGK
jgi:hypothetical protein